MRQHIGSTKVMAWVERIISLGSQVNRAGEAKGFTERHYYRFGHGGPLKIADRKPVETFSGYRLKDVRVYAGSHPEEASRRSGAQAFTFRGKAFGSRPKLDTKAGEGLGMLAHELTHVIQQNRPHHLTQRQVAHQEDGAVSAKLLSDASDAKMALLASVQRSPLPAGQRLGEFRAQANGQPEQMVFSDDEPGSQPQVNIGQVADMVYRLMQRDLILERERATRVGG